MATAAASVGREQQLTVVDHLQELRTRLIVSLAVIAVAFGLCMWQNQRLLDIVNAPLAHQTQKQVRAGQGPLGSTYSVQQNARTVAVQLQGVIAALARPGSGISPETRRTLAGAAPELSGAITRLSAPPAGDRPVTLGIGEPFTTTVGVAFIFAMILALPVVLYEIYAFLLPALSPQQRRATTPLMLAIPFLFVMGVVFGYLVVLPAAVRFFQNFNSGQFNVLVQASQYYHFAAITMLAMGLVFQVPVGVLAATRAGVVSTEQLRRNRRYAIAACGAVAALLPGDAITLVLETVPLYLLFEFSVLLARLLDRRDARRATTGQARPGGG